MSVVQTTRRARIGLRLLWGLPILAAIIGLGFAYAAVRTTNTALAIDPCANSFDNSFTRISQITFLGGIAASVVILLLSSLTKDREGVRFGILATVLGLVVMFFGFLVASAGYGWHCPDY